MEFDDIIRNSEKRLNKLKIATNFFDHSQIIAISVRTKVIHDIFFLNQTLDFNKLELFHLQYTDSLLDLLMKFKKKIEQNYLLINNEIQINSDAINSFEREIKKDDFRERVVTHNLIMQAFLKTLYRDLAFEDKSNHLAFKERDNLANEMGIEYFRKIGLHEYEQLLTISSNSLYEIFNFKIEKKLLGKLNIQKFKFKFHCGFQYNNQFIEIYEFINSNEYFIFLKERRELFFIQLADFSNIDFSKNTSNKKEILLQLNQKNEELIEKSKRTLKVIPTEIEIVLTDYYNKIAAIEFLDDLQNIDEQTNILRTMLNIKIN